MWSIFGGGRWLRFDCNINCQLLGQNMYPFRIQNLLQNRHDDADNDMAFRGIITLPYTREKLPISLKIFRQIPSLLNIFKTFLSNEFCLLFMLHNECKFIHVFAEISVSKKMQFIVFFFRFTLSFVFNL